MRLSKLCYKLLSYKLLSIITLSMQKYQFEVFQYLTVFFNLKIYYLYISDFIFNKKSLPNCKSKLITLNSL